MRIFALSLQDARLSLRDIVSDIPHDVPALVVYAMLAVFFGFIWWGSRRTSHGEEPNSATDRTPSPPPREERRD
jgi:hypothetical protein